MSVGDLQYLTLLAVARLGEEAFARRIRRTLRDVAGREVSVSTVFVTLTRLEDRGLLRSVRGDPPARGGRRVRIFALTDEGWDAVRATRRASDRMWKGLEPA
ncbi:MAG: PadR family transcriptional regulator [Gemmatimonadota bacterium]|jgi:DNA-binding PadR family transcriptional regulator